MARIIFIANEHVWYHHRNYHQILDGIYSLKVSADTPATPNTKTNRLGEGEKYYAMLDVNRCLYLTSATYGERLASPGTYFQNTLLDLCMIQPEKRFSEKQKESHK